MPPLTNEESVIDCPESRVAADGVTEAANGDSTVTLTLTGVMIKCGVVPKSVTFSHTTYVFGVVDENAYVEAYPTGLLFPPMLHV